MDRETNGKVQHSECEMDQVASQHKGIGRILNDMKKKEFIPIKILFFFVMASIGVLLPYMTIHMKSLGMTVEETAIIYGVYPLFSILAPSTVGMIGDKIGDFKVLLHATLLLCGVNALLFLTLPNARESRPYPVNLSLAMGCRDDHLTLTDLDSKTCDFRNEIVDNLTLTWKMCGYVCHNKENVVRNLQKLSDAERKSSGIVEYNRAVFVPADWAMNFTCSQWNFMETCQINRTLPSNHSFILQVRLRLNTSTESVYDVENIRNGKISMDRIQCGFYDHPIHSVMNAKKPIQKRELSEENSMNLSNPIEELLLSGSSDCRTQCLFQLPRNLTCSNKADVTEFNPQLTFWLYLILRVLYAITLSGSMVLFEGACLAIIMQHTGDIGLQRLFGVIGLMIFSPVSGALIDYFSIGLPVPDFRPAFYLYAAMIGISAELVLLVNLNFKPPAEKLLKDIRAVLKNIELDVFFVVNFLSGLYWGYIESYLFWFLEDMGGTKSLMGLTLTVSALSGIPALIVSRFIFRKLGHPNVQVLGFAFYVIRLFGYSFIYDPSMCLVFETMEAVTTSLMTTSAIAYSAQLGTPSTLASIQGIVSGTYYGMGRGAGSFIGGFLMKIFGTRTTFQILGVCALITGFVYFLFNIFYIRPKHRRKVDGKCANENSNGDKIQPEMTTNEDNIDGTINPTFLPDEPKANPQTPNGVNHVMDETLSKDKNGGHYSKEKKSRHSPNEESHIHQRTINPTHYPDEFSILAQESIALDVDIDDKQANNR